MQMDKPHIIPATLDDIDSIYRIEGKVFHHNSWSYEMIRVELLDGKINGKTWVLNINNNIIGYCMVRFGPDEVHIINMAIDTKFQQNGYGKKLIHHILEETPINSFVFLEVKRSNFPAISLYLNVGFEKIQIRNKYYSDGADAIVMRLQK